MTAVLDELLAAAAAVPVVSIAALGKCQGLQQVLKGLDLQVGRGEVVALMGAAGAGKSMLLRCVLGLENFHEGSLSVQGGPPPAPGAARRPVELVADGPGLLPHLSTGHNLMLASALAERPDADGQARDLLARVGLAECFNLLPGQLSAAQQRRVLIARAMAPEPAVLLCDDLTSPDDPEQAGEVGLALRALAADGLAVLLATHDRGLARAADRLVFLHDGRVHEQGAPAALLDAPQTPELRHFLTGRSAGWRPRWMWPRAAVRPPRVS